MFIRLSLIVALLFVFNAAMFAQKAAPQGETTCTFADGKQVTIRYPELPYSSKSELPDGQPWPADNSPIYLFSQANLSLGKTSIPAGAYSLYTVPGKKDVWDLVVTRDVKQDGHYDSAQDVSRVPMQTGTLSNGANAFRAYFGHTGPDTCSLRLDYGKQRGYTDFGEKK